MSYQITDIFIYPVKSLSGYAPNEAYALTAGFRYDRRWMIVDTDNHFLTQRQIPEMSQITAVIESENLVFKYKNDIQYLSVGEKCEPVFEVRVWDDIALAHDTSSGINQWLSEILQRNVRLVRMKDEQSRSHFSATTGDSYSVSLADGYPYLVISDKSIELLNQKLNEKISVLRFRPNLVVTASTSHEEDGWAAIHTSEAAFKNIKPCGRCIMINVNPFSGSIIDKEPLSTLSRYRKKGNSVLFGTNMVCIKEGNIKKGEIIHVKQP